MRETLPKVKLICRPQIDWKAIGEYLDEVGGMDWRKRSMDDWRETLPMNNSETDSNADHGGEFLVEFAGRMCYRSWAPGLNPNVTKIREDRAGYLENILKSGHGSVLEHANYTFVFYDVSRVFTHELVRHRAGTAFSQESLRYVRLTDIPFRIPDELTDGLDREESAYVGSRVQELVESMEDFQTMMADMHGLDDEKSFAKKKHVTSAMRRLAPLGLSTAITMTANIRALRHMIEMRTSGGAEEEMQTVFKEVFRIMSDECPLLFGDYDMEPGPVGHEMTKYRKV